MKQIVSSVIVTVICVLLTACGSFGPTSPNVSILDPKYSNLSDANFAEAQTILNDIAIQNDLFAREIGKLPELQDRVDQNDLKTLRVIRTVYQEHPKAFDDAFAEMYMVGKPEVRKYCSPLQAVYWLAEENYFAYNHSIIERYSLQQLLELAWSSPKQTSGLYLLKIIHEYRDEEYRNEMLSDFSELPLGTMKGFIFQDFQHDRNKFTDAGKQYIKDAMSGEAKDKKWDDYQVVVERLNSPELVNHFLNKFITYKAHGRAHGAYPTFRGGYGHCTDASYLARHMLSRAGYDTFMRSVRWGPNDWTDVHTGSGIILDDGFYLIVADFRGGAFGNRLSGPYKTIEEVDKQLSSGPVITDRGWGAFFPPP